MHFDLELLLVGGSVLTGLVWLLDLIWFRRARRATAGVSADDAGKGGTHKEEHEPWYAEYARSFFPVLVVVLILRSFIAEPFRIPSGSMMPTLLVGDFILVNKFAYGFRLPVIHKKVLGSSTPERGDVVVFRWPMDPSLDYIKRVVALPGDRVRYVNKQLFINDKEIQTTEVGSYQGMGKYALPYEYEFTEDLEGVEHNILVNRGRQNRDYMDVVPEGHYFVMGDNRDNSNDSRFWGFVPEENLVGEAMIIWMNWNFDESSADFSRIGTKID